MNLPTKCPKHATKFPTVEKNFCMKLRQQLRFVGCSMGSSMLSSISESKAVGVFGMLCLTLLVQKSGALEFTIGGANGWTVPASESSFSYNQWAERTRFQIGDSLLFVYKPDQDSVLQVSKEGYDNCNTASPITKYDDGQSVFTFNNSGPYYFISGNKDNCLKHQKMIIVVTADRSNRLSNTNATSPQASPPSPESSGMVPAPTPVGDESPPAGSVEINPTPSPASSTPSEKNAASSMFTSFIGIVGAVFTSLALVL